MKKIVLSLLAASALSTAFAQNTTSLNQNGTSNNSKTNQYGANQNANITQNGVNNVNDNQQLSTKFQLTTVNQQGNYSTATTRQNNDAGPQNYINVNQTGTGTSSQRNNATVDQSSVFTQYSRANVTQRGYSMDATVNQFNAVGDLATIDQGGYSTGNTGRNQKATINQGVFANGGANSTNSTAYIQQLSSYSQEATISQLGDNNTAYTYQNNNAGPGNVANTNQNGNFNFAQINQSNFSTISTEGLVTQKGNNNTTYLDQLGANTSSGRINQNGNNNTTRLSQGNGFDNRATIDQIGSFNTVEGLGGTGTFAIQNGYSGNRLTISQVSGASGPGHTAMVSQTGSGNTGTISQAP